MLLVTSCEAVYFWIMARRRIFLSPLEWLIVLGLGLGLVYGLYSWTASRADCVYVPGSLVIEHNDAGVAYLSGTMAGQATCKLRALARSNPEIETLVLVEVPGTVDLVDTQAATRLVRNKGWNTVVPSQGLIASGGVMLFLGGVEREVSEGGQVGVHAWSQPGGGGVLFSSPENIPANAERAFRQIYRALGIDPGFYDFQVESAPANDIHWMTREELARWGVVTGSSAL